MTLDQPSPLMTEALRWLVLLREDSSVQTQATFQAWLSSSPEHQAAWNRAQHVWQRIGIIEPALQARVSMPNGSVASRRPPGRRVARWLQLAAAACLLVALGGYAITSYALLADHRTTTAELRSLHLADGSQVQLGSATALSVEIGPVSRMITLHRGEAHFTVAPDSTRPFIVRAAGGQTRALGTAFAVKIMTDGAVVTVNEHAVAVQSPDGRSVQVNAGEQVRYDGHGLSQPQSVDVASVLAWRRSRLVFYDAPLAEVVADLERYRTGRILLTDGSLKNLPVTAVLDTTQTDAAIATIAQTLSVKLRQFGPLLAVISPAD